MEIENNPTDNRDYRCPICADPATAEYVADALVSGKTRVSITKHPSVKYPALKVHVRVCLAGTEIEERIEAAATARQIERERRHEQESRNILARKEAEHFFSIVGQNGETVESLRRSIPISSATKRTITELFGSDFAADVERGRLDVLVAFDRLAACPPQGFAERTARRRAALVREYRRYAARPQEIPASRVKGDEWN